ncbi:hypothetical protein V1525DRAFT_356831 [Lipomyces kononenkoae]|uniref:Uncharacterized protein n=1 Tax=Lipomyces kononenkoae TaxID=34357 RepID=A0ACC3T611_LIPKO
MSKRRPTNQITRETYHDDDDDSFDNRHGPPDVTVEASPQVLAGRKILQPRSRKVNGVGAGVGAPSPVSGNPFGSLSSASPLSANSKPVQSLASASTPSPAGISSNPFSFLSQTPNTTLTASATPNAESAPAPSTGFNFGSQPPSFSFNASKTVSTPTPESQPSFNFNRTTPAPAPPPAATAQASAPTSASDKPFSSTEYVRWLKIRALNEKFRDSVTTGLEKDALGDLAPLCKAYVAFFDRIDKETKEAAKSQAEFAAIKDEEPAKAPAANATTSTNSTNFTTAGFSFAKPATATTTPSFLFGQPAVKAPEIEPKTSVSESKPSTLSFKFSATAPAFPFNKPTTDTNATAAAPEKKVDSPMTVLAKAKEKQEEPESDAESADSDSVPIQGPSFVTKPELLSSTESPFQFKPSADSVKSDLDGPSFTFSPSTTAKVSSPFKFAANSPAPEKLAESKPPSSTPAPAHAFSFGLPSSGSSPSITPANAGSPPQELEEAKKPAFGFGTSSFTSSPFSFGTGSAFGASTESDGTKGKPTTPPPSDGNITTGSPLKLASLGTSNTSTGLNPFTIKSTTESQSSPFKFNVPAPSTANTPSVTPSKPAVDSKSTTDMTTPKPALFQTDKPTGTGSTPVFSFGVPSSSSSSSPFANNTWTPDKGIKFAQQDDKATTLGENSASKPSSSGPAFSFNNPLGSTSAVSPFTPSTVPPSNGSASGSAGFSFGGASAFKPAVGFSFGSSPSSSATKPGPAASLAEASKEGTPAESSGGEGIGGEDGDAAPPEKQINLSTEKGPGEEEEDVVLEGRTKVFQYKTAAERKAEAKDDQTADMTDGFVTIGLGPYRVLTHQKTKKTRILVRADGSGRVVLNVALRKNVDYSATDTSVRILDFIEGGKGVTYLLKVKTKADAEKLRDVLQERKNA